MIGREFSLSIVGFILVVLGGGGCRLCDSGLILGFYYVSFGWWMLVVVVIVGWWPLSIGLE